MIWTLTWPSRSSACADRADPAVHHVGRGDDVGAGRGLDQRLLDQHRAGRVVEHIARRVDQPVMAVRRIGIERDVGEHADLGRRLLHRPDRAADEIVGVERLARHRRCAARAACWGTGRRRECRGRAPRAPCRRAGRPTSATRPARLATGSSTPCPSAMNSGQIRSAGRQHRLREQRPAPGGGAGAAQAEGGEGGVAHGARL